VCSPRAAGGTPLSNAGGLPADQLDSWLAVPPDGTVSVFTSKGRFSEPAPARRWTDRREELDVPVLRIRMEIGDTTRSVDQGRTSASRTLERAGPQLRRLQQPRDRNC